MRQHRTKAICEARISRAERVGAHRTVAATKLRPVAAASSAKEPPHSARSPTGSSPFAASWLWRHPPSRHILLVGSCCRCYPPPWTREIIHPTYQSTPRTRDAVPCALPRPDSLVTACGWALPCVCADGRGWRHLSPRFRPAAQPGLVASSSQPQRPIQSFFCEQRTTRERPGSAQRASPASAAEGGVVSARARLACVTPMDSGDGP